MLWVLIRRRGDSNKYMHPQHMFLWRTDENYLSVIIKNSPYLFHCSFLHIFWLAYTVSLHVQYNQPSSSIPACPQLHLLLSYLNFVLKSLKWVLWLMKVRVSVFYKHSFQYRHNCNRISNIRIGKCSKFLLKVQRISNMGTKLSFPR